MKVLISGGLKTDNIINALNNRLGSSGIDFISVPYIEDVKEVFSRGEYFDRAIIAEYSWTHDSEDNDESTWRIKVNDFASNMRAMVNGNASYLFISQTNEMAEIIDEEILDIRNESALIVKAPSYTVNFFVMLVEYELNDIPQKYLYTPPTPEEEVIDNNDNNQVQYQDNFSYENDGEDNNANRLPIDEGFTTDDLGNDGSDPDWGDQLGDDFGDDLVDQIDNGFDNNSNQDNFGSGDFSIPQDIDNDLGNIGDGLDGLDGLDDDLNNLIDELGDDFGDPVDTQENQISEPETEPQGFDDSDFKTGEIPDYSGPDAGFNPLGGDVNREYPGPDDYTAQNQNYVDPNQDYVDPNQDYVDNNQGYNNQNYPGDDYDQYQNDYQGNDYGNQTQPEYGPSNSDYDQDYDQNTPDGPEEYDEQEINQNRRNNRPSLSNNQLRATLDAFASRGVSIVVTGCGGCGTSTIAYSLANTVCNLGYDVLLIDMDTENKAQSYIAKDNYEAIGIDSADVMAAVNSSDGINAYTAVIRPGFNLLSMGMAADSRKPEEAFNQPQRLNRFVAQARNSHQFVIYDIPFDAATHHLSDITMAADDIVLVTDASNWGISKTLISAYNIGNSDVEETIFSRGQILFNKYRGLKKVFGHKVRKGYDITKQMDAKAIELVGQSTGYSFTDMKICGIIKDIPTLDSFWFNGNQYTDTKAGFDQFATLLKDILLHS